MAGGRDSREMVGPVSENADQQSGVEHETSETRSPKSN